MAKKFGEIYEDLPNYLINFPHDPLACAVALGFSEGAGISNIPLKFESKERLVEMIM